MDAKDLRTETTLSERRNDGTSKFGSSMAGLSCNNNKTFDAMPSNPLAKAETPTSRPCAVIGPDRVVPPPSTADAYLKKGHYEPWPPMDNTYRQPPEYPLKMPSYLSPLGNISPRQTFQENMQRIMVQPTYNSKVNEDAGFAMERNLSKNSKINGPAEPKYCDVPYSINPMTNDQKNNEMCVPNVNNPRNYPQMWHSAGVNMRPPRSYGAPDLYPYQEYTSCAGQRPAPITRPHRTINEDAGHIYGDTYYHEGNIRFKPYPNVKERYPQPRYEYVTNYPNPFHPFPPYKYDVMQKPLLQHPTHSQIPMKYIDNRIPDSVLDGYQRTPQGPYVSPYRNQGVHPPYGPVLGNNIPNKMYYPPEGPIKPAPANKLPYENKMYLDYDAARNKGFPVSENLYEMRPHIKNQVIIPNYPAPNVQPMHPHSYYRKDHLSTKNLEYISHLRHLDPSLNHNSLTKMSSQFSPTAIAISPSDSNTSNDTAHTQGGSLEDCGYVSQSSTASVRSLDSGVNRIMHNDVQRRYNFAYPPTVRTSPLTFRPDVNSNTVTKNKKGIDVRQFLQMWNEGDEENGANQKEVSKSDYNNANKQTSQYEVAKTQEQLYVLGLMNVPSEELGKYEHIQKVSKLPENIKGYNNIELLKHFEEAIESSSLNNQKQPLPRNYQSITKNSLMQALPPRPLSPLDVEAKISQSVIHKEVGCNFEIRPCSPQMLNVEMATPAQNILNERTIEKVSNPLLIKPPSIIGNSNGNEGLCHVMKQNDHTLILNDSNKIPSCKMINTQCANNDTTHLVKANYSLQDLEGNAGVCLASLPRLDNDIELNFQEVNQQFINANKESVITTTDSSNKPHITPFNTCKPAEGLEIAPKVLPSETDKDFSKLSKYRKNKKNNTISQDKQIEINSQSLRTDSVIIKNPENVKSIEYNMLDNQSNDKGMKEESQIYLTEGRTVSPSIHSGEKILDNGQDFSNEIAIDFSLNKFTNSKLNENLKTERGIKSASGMERYYNNEELCKNTQRVYEIPFDTDSAKPKSSLKYNTAISSSMLPKSRENHKNDENYLPSITEQENLTIKETTLSENKIQSTSVTNTLPVKNHIYSHSRSETEITNNTEKAINYFGNTSSENKVTLDTNECNIATSYILSHAQQNVSTRSEIHNDEKENECLNNEHVSKNKTYIKSDSPKSDTLPSVESTETNCSREPVTLPSIETTETNCDLVSNSESSTITIDSHVNLQLVKNINSPDPPQSTTHIENEIVTAKNMDSTLDIEKKSETNENTNIIVLTDENTSLKSPHPTHTEKHCILFEDDKNSKDRSISNKFLLPSSVCVDTACSKDNFIAPDHAKSDSVDTTCIENEIKNTSLKPVVNVGDAESVLTTSMDVDCNSIDVKEDKEEQDKTDTNMVFVENINSEPLDLIDNEIGRESNVNLAFVNDAELIDADTNENYNHTNINLPSDDIKNNLIHTVCETDPAKSDNTNHCIDETATSFGISQLRKSQEKRTERKSLWKELHSPWIQKLIMKTEGTCANVNISISKNDFNCCLGPLAISAGMSSHLQALDSLNERKDVVDSHKTDSKEMLDLEIKQVGISITCKDSKEVLNSTNKLDCLDLEQKSISSTNVFSSTVIAQENSSIDIITLVNNELCSKNISSNTEINSDMSDTLHHSNRSKEINDENGFSELNIGKVNTLSPKSVPVETSEEQSLVDIISRGNEKVCDIEICRHTELNILEVSNKSNKLDDKIISINENKLYDQNNDHESMLLEKDLNLFDTSKEHSVDSHDKGHKDNILLDIPNANLAKISGSEVDGIETETSTSKNTENQKDDLPLHILCSIDYEEDSIEKSLNLIHADNPPVKNQKQFFTTRRLKRSLSESALDMYCDDVSETSSQEEVKQNTSLWPKKIRKSNKAFLNICSSQFNAHDVFNVQNNRRNSVTSTYNGENMAFCILIDNNCIITEENEEEEKICYDVSEECVTTIHEDSVNVDMESTSEVVLCPEDSSCEYAEPLILEIADEKAFEFEVDDIACVETVVSDDIAEDIIISAPSTPNDIDESDDDEANILNKTSEHTEKVKYIYGDKMCNDDAELVETLYRTPQMDVNKTLVNREPHLSDDCENNPVESIFCEANEVTDEPENDYDLNVSANKNVNIEETSDEENNTIDCNNRLPVPSLTKEPGVIDTWTVFNASLENSQENDNSCESSIDEVFLPKQDENFNAAFSSPEVSSTTTEEKNSTILLKITNYKGMRTSHLADINLNASKSNSCRFTENVNYSSYQSNSSKPRPLITKAAQKYIPPSKDTIVSDLKVKLPLPHQSLMKFKELKSSKTERRHCTAVSKKDVQKKPKPKFEDVLKSIDEIQFKMHKEKSKKPKKAVPKVVIKKNENGSHYASTPTKESFNPDLTGRKWQPWVFIEKNSFVDKMAIKKKSKAIFNHRKNTYVFADKFKKYKSIPSAKFVISQPKQNDSATGQFKYTIKLKHSY